LADFLARTCKARLALVGRSSLPPREQWDEWLTTHEEDEPTSRRIRRVLTIEENGGEILLIAADAGNRQEMQRGIELAYAQFGELHGVIHGAGNVSADAFSPVNQVNPLAGEKQFRPKARGIHVLDDLLRDKPLDFCVLLSSLSSVL